MSVMLRHDAIADQGVIKLRPRLEFVRANAQASVEEILRRSAGASGRTRAGYFGVTPAPLIWLLVGLLRNGANALARAVTGNSMVATARARVKVAGEHAALGGAVKRVLDVSVASVALIVLLPIMLFVALAVRLSLGTPIFFSHPRVGLHGRPFRCYKFRTMVTNADEVLKAHLSAHPEAEREWQESQKLQDDPRVTLLGRVLRKTSLDELPQLVNVLKGDMSCVGPRPIVTAELSKYGPHARHYLRARPGLTGIWQVSGRSSTTYRRRVVMDTFYVRRWSFWRDLRLLALTIPAMIKTDDAA